MSAPTSSLFVATPPFTALDSGALAAKASALINSRVRFVVRVPARAMSLRGPKLPSPAAPNVFSMGYSFEVLRPDAVAVSTTALFDMIPDEALGGRPSEEVVGFNNALPVPELSVAVTDGADPNHAAVCAAGVDVPPKELGSVAGLANVSSRGHGFIIHQRGLF